MTSDNRNVFVALREANGKAAVVAVSLSVHADAVSLPGGSGYYLAEAAPKAGAARTNGDG